MRVSRPSLELLAISLLSILSAEIMDLSTGSGPALLSGCGALDESSSFALQCLHWRLTSF